MAERSVWTGKIVLDTAVFPARVLIAAQQNNIKFKKITPNGNKLSEVAADLTTKEECDRTECDYGFELEKGLVIPFTKEEREQLLSDDSRIFIEKCVPTEIVDSIIVNSSFYIKPGKGGDVAFQALSSVLKKKDLYAIGRWAGKNLDRLIGIRSYKDGLMMQSFYYSNEIRDYSNNISRTATAEDIEMMDNIVEKLSRKRFDHKAYGDIYAERVIKAAEKKKSIKKSLASLFDSWK